MKRLLLPLLLLFGFNVIAQNCESLRYVDEIFNDVERNTYLYGNADPYGIFSSQDLFMDVYTPVGDTLTKRPVIVFAYGGAFLIGDRRQPIIPEYCEYFSRRGYVTVSIDYRLGYNPISANSTERAVYRAVQDLRAAQRYLAEFSTDLGIDIEHMFLTGTSAGCVTAFHSVYLTEADRPSSTFGILLEPSDLGCPNCSGNTYFNSQDVPVKGIINHWGAIQNLNWIDTTAHDNVPCLSFHGTQDLVVPYNCGNAFQLPIWPQICGSGEIHPRLDEVGIDNQLVTFYGAGHEPELTDMAYLDTMLMFATPFLFDLVKPETGLISGMDTLDQSVVETYSVPASTGSDYCWDIGQANLVSDNGNEIQISWDTPGTYTISVTELNCLHAEGDQQTLQVVVEPLTSIEDPNAANEIVIYPNPLRPGDDLKVELNGFQDLPFEKITINDINGRIIFEDRLTALGGIIIPGPVFAQLSSGIYVIKLEGQRHNLSRKLLLFPQQR
ncbi:MAG: carboxylesterase family protein [Bacteroidota bacterium]